MLRILVPTSFFYVRGAGERTTELDSFIEAACSFFLFGGEARQHQSSQCGGTAPIKNAEQGLYLQIICGLYKQRNYSMESSTKVQEV